MSNYKYDDPEKYYSWLQHTHIRDHDTSKLHKIPTKFHKIPFTYIERVENGIYLYRRGEGSIFCSYCGGGSLGFPMGINVVDIFGIVEQEAFCGQECIKRYIDHYAMNVCIHCNQYTSSKIAISPVNACCCCSFRVFGDRIFPQFRMLMKCHRCFKYKKLLHNPYWYFVIANIPEFVCNDCWKDTDYGR